MGQNLQTPSLYFYNTEEVLLVQKTKKTCILMPAEANSLKCFQEL